VTGYKGRSPVRARFYDAGHVLGSVGILIEYQEDGVERNVFYTGDTGMKSQTILPGASYPEEPLDTLLLESTLGADTETENTSRRGEEKRLGEAIAETIKAGGTVLIPVFALGRGQEIVALVDRYKNRGLIPEDTPMYTAGLMRAISNVYDKTRHTTPRLNEDFQVFGVPQSRLPRSQAALKNALTQPGIHVVGSGMMFERTISNRLAITLAESEKNAILLVGYTPPDSPGHHILEAAKLGRGTMVAIDKTTGEQPLNCRVERYRFSGHSHRRDLLKLVDQLEPDQIVLVHGETKARDWMMDNIRYFHPAIDINSPATGEELTI
jgi:Cft2 family RNA processing exonuclease